VNSYRIMVADDEPITRMDIREILEEQGYHVVAEGKNGEEAVELAHRLNLDLIIMDVKMPVLDGLKAAEIIRKFSDTAILLLTAYSDKEIVSKAKNAGVVAYLVKPVSERDLIPAVEIALSQRTRLLSLQNDINTLKRKIEERKRVEKAKGLIMQQYSCSEAEAYEWMRNRSMQLRKPMGQLAEELLQEMEKVQ
jgi:AmiR/NasT family two-component response regulator